MLRVTIELIPKGNEAKKRLMCIGELSNDMSGSEEDGNYQAWFSMFSPRTHEVWKYATVKGFSRKTRGAWDLLYLALRDAVGSRNP